ncbi:MAG: glycosyltransferase family 4 protein [Candidatus Coatesbacteria bacterium]|nr:glycosyltransferase family 4 protein [Candidatus Coatesbacteria bacterium]
MANKIQRWLFSRPGFGGPVTVNAIWGGNRRHIYSVFNSSITRSQLEKTREIAQSKRLGNPTRFLYVGRIDSNKNLDVILRAFAKARAEAGKEMRLDIVGNGPDLPAIKVLADDLGLSGSSFFHGHKSPNAVCKIYAGSHILLLASSAEGWPKTPMEAMCHGVPSICSNVSTLPMILGNEERGLLVEPRDVQGLASAMKRLATNNELYVRMSRAGRKWVENKTREDLMIQIKSILEGAWGIELRTPI